MMNPNNSVGEINKRIYSVCLFTEGAFIPIYLYKKFLNFYNLFALIEQFVDQSTKENFLN